MTDHAPDNSERRFPTLAVVLCVVIGLPVLYVLSAGPVHWLSLHGYIGNTAGVARFYQPLDYIVRHSGTIGQAIRWYMHRWE